VHRVGMAALDASLTGSRELGLAAVAHLPRYRGTSREHTESDLRIFFAWCQDRQLAPLDARRNDLELYLRWMQELRRFKPSTVSRRLSVVAGFYRTCVIDGVLEHSPAEYVRRPTVPPESPTLGLTHLQFEALLTAARQSCNPFDFALVCLLGLLGLGIFETVGADIDDLGEEHGHRVLRVRGKGGKVVLVPLPPAVSRAVDRAAGERPGGPLLLNRRGVRMDRHAATRRLRSPGGRRRRPTAADAPAHAAAHLRHHDARRGGLPARRPDRGSARRPADHHAVRPSPQEPRPPPELHPRCVHGVRHLTPSADERPPSPRWAWLSLHWAISGCRDPVRHENQAPPAPDSRVTARVPSSGRCADPRGQTARPRQILL